MMTNNLILYRCPLITTFLLLLNGGKKWKSVFLSINSKINSATYITNNVNNVEFHPLGRMFLKMEAQMLVG